MKKFRRILLRFLLSMPIIAIQIVWYLFIYRWYKEQSFILSVFVTVLEVLLILHILNARGTSNYRMIWLVVILLVPVVGIYMYIITGNNSTATFLEKRIRKSDIYPAPESLDIPDEPDEYRLLNLIEKLSKSPVTNGGKTKFYSLGDYAFEDMIESLKSASHFIFLEYFIIEDGYFWNSIVDILKQKVKEGVVVKVLYDDIGSLATYSISSRNELKKSGIDIIAFNSLRFSPFMLNNRDHRKMMIVDNRAVYSGGINLADEYIGKKITHGYWKDFAFRLEGEPVLTYTHNFCMVWNAFSKNKIIEPDLYKPETSFVNPDSKIISYFDSPSAKEHVSQTYFINALGGAKKYAYFYTPYLILSDELKNAFIYAAMRDVDVRIIIPGVPDKKLIYRLTLRYAEELSSYGIKVYADNGAFVHAKAAVIDDKICSVGTVNLDYRSLFLHYENNTVTTDGYMISSIKKDFEETLDNCSPVKYRKHNIFYKIIFDAINFFSPLF